MQVVEKGYIKAGLEGVLSEFKGLSGQEAIKLLQCYAKMYPPLSPDTRTMENRVMGCTAQVSCLIAPNVGLSLLDCTLSHFCGIRGSRHNVGIAHIGTSWEKNLRKGWVGKRFSEGAGSV